MEVEVWSAERLSSEHPKDHLDSFPAYVPQSDVTFPQYQPVIIERQNNHQYLDVSTSGIVATVQHPTFIKTEHCSSRTSSNQCSHVESVCTATFKCEYNEQDVFMPDQHLNVKNGQDFEVYHDLIMQHLVQDIQLTCGRFGIRDDPRTWSVEDSQKWLISLATQYHLTNVPFDELSLPGQLLCSLGLENLKNIYPTGGELLHAQLKVWMAASDYNRRYKMHQMNGLPPQMVENALVNNTQMSNPQISFKGANVGKRSPPHSVIVDKASNFRQHCIRSPATSVDSGISPDYEDSTVIDGSAACSDNANVTIVRSHIHLWQFLRELLDEPIQYAFCIRWMQQSEGIFKIEDSHVLAKLWGQRKRRPAMNYDKLSRSLRQYYKKGILKKTPRSQRLVYQFLPPFHNC